MPVPFKPFHFNNTCSLCHIEDKILKATSRQHCLKQMKAAVIKTGKEPKSKQEMCSAAFSEQISTVIYFFPYISRDIFGN